MIKKFVSHLIPSNIKFYIKKRIKYFHELNGKTNEKFLKQKVKEVKQKEKINVLFITAILSMWKGQGIYELLKKDKRFNVKIIISPFAKYDKEDALKQVINLKKFFFTKGISVPSTTDDNFDLENWLNNFNPDIIFFCQHYEKNHNNILDVEHQTHRLRCLIPYGQPTMRESFVYDSTFHNLCWRVYHATKLHYKTAKFLMKNNAYNVRIVGESNVDKYISSVHTNPWKIINDNKHRRKIIWAPHFTIESNGLMHRASFSWLYKDMLNLAQKYKDQIQIAFKPHPHLYNTLCNLNDWGNKRTQEYYRLWNNMINTQLVEGDYTDLFYFSDAMIHDCGSFTGEYMYVKKPVMFTSKNFNEILSKADDYGKKCLELHDIGKSTSDVEEFIKYIIDDKDVLKDQRDKFFNKFLLPPNGKSVAENIYDDLLKSLNIK